MKPRNTLILVALFALAAWYVFGVELNSPESAATPTPSGPAPTQVLDIPPEQITGITIQARETVSRTVMSKTAAGDWVVEAPLHDDADAFRAAQTASQFGRLSASRVITQGIGDLGAFGLITPTYVMTLTLQDGKTEVLSVGDATPQQSGVYAMRAGNPNLYVLGTVIKTTIDDLLNRPPYKPTPTPTPPPEPTEEPTATPKPSP